MLFILFSFLYVCVFFSVSFCEFGMVGGSEEGVLFLGFNSPKQGEKKFWSTDLYFVFDICIIPVSNKRYMAKNYIQTRLQLLLMLG